MSITIKSVCWRTVWGRTKPMPAAHCHHVRDSDTGERIDAWMGIIHCNACAWCHEIHLDHMKRTGEVHCAAPKHNT